MAKRPHIFVALAQNALTIAHSLRDNYFRNTAEEGAKLLPDLDRGEALISGQCVQFPVMARIKPPHSQGEKQEKDLIRLVMEEE